MDYSPDTHAPSTATDPQDIAARALAEARAEFEQREAQMREELSKAIAAYRSLEEAEGLVKASREELQASTKALSSLGLERSNLAEALGISQATLSRRINPTPRPRRSRTTKSSGTGAKDEHIVSSDSNDETSSSHHHTV